MKTSLENNGMPPEESKSQIRNAVTPELISLYKESTKRTRLLFSISNLAAVILLVCYFNTNFSWSRHPSIYDRVKKNLPEIDYNHLSKIDAIIEWCVDTMSLSPE